MSTVTTVHRVQNTPTLRSFGKLYKPGLRAHLRRVDEPEEGDGSNATQRGDEEAQRARPAQRGTAADEVVVQQQVGGNGAVDDPHQRYRQRGHHRGAREHLEHAKACAQHTLHHYFTFHISILNSHSSQLVEHAKACAA